MLRSEYDYQYFVLVSDTDTSKKRATFCILKTKKDIRIKPMDTKFSVAVHVLVLISEALKRMNS